MSEPLTREEREELRTTLARLITAGSGWYSLPKETMGRLLADLERRDLWHGAYVVALAESRRSLERVEASMVRHFQEEHIAGDGPEIDRWKARLAIIAQLADVPDEDIPKPLLILALSEILATAKGER